MHLFNSIIMYGTADVFPIDVTYVQGIRRGYYTSYYIPTPQSFIEKFGNRYNVMFLILLILILIFLILAFIFRNKIWCRKFKYFPMSFQFKLRYIPVTYGRMKTNCIIGETTYKIADLEKYREYLNSMDLGKLVEEGLGSSYSQLFQNSSAIETLGKLNKEIDTENKDESSNKDISGISNYKDLIPQISGNLKLKEPKLSNKLKIKEEKKEKTDLYDLPNPKVQVLKEGKMFDRRKTFIKNWEYDEENKDAEALDED